MMRQFSFLGGLSQLKCCQCRQFTRFWNIAIVHTLWKNVKICCQRHLNSDVLNSVGHMWECVLYTRLTHVPVCTNICLKHRRLIHHCQSIHTALYTSCLGRGNVQQICFKSKWDKKENLNNDTEPQNIKLRNSFIITHSLRLVIKMNVNKTKHLIYIHFSVFFSIDSGLWAKWAPYRSVRFW